MSGNWPLLENPYDNNVFETFEHSDFPSLESSVEMTSATTIESIQTRSSLASETAAPPTEIPCGQVSFPAQISTEPQKRDAFRSYSESRRISEQEIMRPESQRRKSRTPSFGSLAKRLSYSSSQMNDITCAFKRFSFSSKGTKCSSDILSGLSCLDESTRSGPREVTLDALFIKEYPGELPDGFLQIADALQMSNWCDKCLLLLNDSFCTKCPRHGQFDPCIQKDLAGLETTSLDRFNNSLLHVAAVTNPNLKCIVSLIEQGADLNAVNTAGQTFLHILDPGSSPGREQELPTLISYLSNLSFDFGKRDHHGANFFQVFLQYALEPNTINDILQVIEPILSLIAFRDNLGRTWQSQLLYLAQEAQKTDPERATALYQILWNFSGANAFDFLGKLAFEEVPRASSGDQKAFEDLVTQALTQAFSGGSASAEDTYGRNGLHSLAELSFKHHGAVSMRRQLRRHYFSLLLDAGVNVNSYDKIGNTPILAFLSSQQTWAEGNDDASIEFYLTELVKAGACVDSRNRNGESALHVAVKRGNITATRALIKLGANLNARQKEGKSVVGLGLETAQKMKQRIKLHKSLHIRIMTSVNMVRNRGGITDPTVFQEWDRRKIIVKLQS